MVSLTGATTRATPVASPSTACPTADHDPPGVRDSRTRGSPVVRPEPSVTVPVISIVPSGRTSPVVAAMLVCREIPSKS